MAFTYSQVLGPAYGIALDGASWFETGDQSLYDFEYTDQVSGLVILKTVLPIASQASIVSKFSLSQFRGFDWGIDNDSKPYVALYNSSTVYAKKKASSALVTATEYMLGFRYNGSGYATGIDLFLMGVLSTATISSETLAASTIVASGSKLQVGARDGAQLLPSDSVIGFLQLWKRWVRDEEFFQYAYEAGYT